MENSKQHVYLNLYDITLFKLEVLKFILLYNIKNKQENLFPKINVEPNINFFLSLTFEEDEILILKKNNNNKFFNYTNIKNNKILKYILNSFYKTSEEEKYLSYKNYMWFKEFLKNKNSITETNQISVKNAKLYYNHLCHIKNVYNTFLKKNIFNVSIDYLQIINLYEKFYNSNFSLQNIFNVLNIEKFYNVNDSVFLNNNFSKKEIIKEKKNIHNEKNLRKRIQNDNVIIKSQINNLNNMFLLNKNVTKYTQTENEEEKKQLLNKIKYLEDKIL